MDELQHPSWCAPAHCTATVQKPEYRAGETGYHRSEPVALASVPSVGFVVFDAEKNPLLAHLAQAVAPWDTTTFLNLGPADDPQAVSLRADDAQTVLRQLGMLLVEAASE